MRCGGCDWVEMVGAIGGDYQDMTKDKSQGESES